MSTEREHNQVEHHAESSNSLETARAEKLAELQRHSETTRDDAHERAEAAREAIHGPKQPEETPRAAEEAEATVPATSRVLPHLDYKLNYTQTIASMQRHLKPASRTFSKVIHAPAIEKTSELLEKTVARPSITAGSTWTALIIGSIFYFTARHYGYELSGSEITLSFIVGAIIGLILEALWRAIFRRR